MPVVLPKVYKGDRDYVFVDYAHADRDAVLPIIAALVEEGYRVWYDDGIELTTEYTEDIGDHVYRCSCLVMFVSRHSLASDWCRQEVNYALDLHKKILPIYLEDVELTRGLQLRMGGTQAILWYEYDSDTAFYNKLFKARKLDPCLTDEGRRRRGVKPRSAQAEGVKPKGTLAEYSWGELKQISRAIAATGSDAEWKAVAREYHLVDARGRLLGDRKSLTLNDGTEASVRILGFCHDELVTGGRAGISFEFAGVPVVHRMNADWTNAGGWEKSEMHAWLNDGNGGFLALLPEDLRAHMAEVRKRANNKGWVSQNDTAVVTETKDRLWLLSMSEVYGRLLAQKDNVPWSPATYDAEGTQYKLYADHGVTTTNYDFCTKLGKDSWWLRSPGAHGSDWFRSVGFDGGWHGSYADREWGVSPGFCF